MSRPRRPRVAVAGIRGIPANFGGSETVAEQLGELCAQQGWDITVYCRRHRSTTDAEVYKGMRRVVLPSINTLGLDTPTHSLLSTLHVLLRDTADVIHFHGVGNAMFFPLLKLFRKKSVVTVDGLDWRRPKWGRVARTVLKWSFSWAACWADAIISDNRPAQQYFREVLGRDTSLIPYGADLSAVPGDDAVYEFGLQPREYFLYVGGLIPDKGVHILIEAFEALNTDKKLVIVGDTPYFSTYAAKLKSTEDARVLFTGYLYGAKYRQLLQNAYAYTHPLLADGTSPSLIQAMAARNCVIVGDLPQTLDVVGDAALIFRSGDSGDLRRQMARALEQPDLVAGLREQARARVELHYSWPIVAARYAEVYLDVAGGRPRIDLR